MTLSCRAPKAEDAVLIINTHVENALAHVILKVLAARPTKPSLNLIGSIAPAAHLSDRPLVQLQHCRNIARRCLSDTHVIVTPIKHLERVRTSSASSPLYSVGNST